MDDPHLKRTKSANETNEPGVDRFSKLPNELLQRIFALAYAKKKPSQPLSRRLRPFYDEIVFRKIKADSSSRIRSLRKLSTKRPGLGSHLRELVIQEAGQQSCLSLDEIKTVFGCLSNLQTLTLYTEGRGWLEAVLPNNPDVKTVLPSSTVSLTIVASSRQRGDAYRPDRLSSLAQRPGLTELALDFSSNYKNLDVPCATVSDLVLPNIINLSVGLPKVTSSVNAFLDCFPHVRKLTLTSHADAPDFATALASIKSPAEVVELTIRASPKAEWRFPDELAAFSSLNSLSDISAKALTALLGDEGLCPTIKTVRLDNVSAEAPVQPRAKYKDSRPVLDKVEVPFWTSAFTEDDFLELEQASKEAGVRLKGPAVIPFRYI
ncbi:hypothetical protein JCM8115_005750 [Rhodotorula mucilaginosa]